LGEIPAAPEQAVPAEDPLAALGEPEVAEEAPEPPEPPAPPAPSAPPAARTTIAPPASPAVPQQPRPQRQIPRSIFPSRPISESKVTLINKLVILANKLDSEGKVEEADKVDKLIEYALDRINKTGT
jgi:hypothetical protein